MKPNVNPVFIPKTSNIEDLRRSVETAIGRLTTQLNRKLPEGEMDMGIARIKNLASPVEPQDAVSLDYLRQYTKDELNKLFARVMHPDLSLASGYNAMEFKIVPGGFTINGVDFSKALPGTFSSEFKVDSNTFKMNSIDAGIIRTGILEVGGTYDKNRVSRLKVFDTANPANLIGWVGDDTAGSGYVGAWFKRVLIGGNNPSQARFFCDVNGYAVMAGVYVYDNTGTLGWIGVNPADITQTGAWLRNIGIGGTGWGPTNSKFWCDSSGNVSINGATITLSANNIKTTISNTATDDAGAYIGVKVEQTQLGNGGAYCSLGALGLEVKGPQGVYAGIFHANQIQPYPTVGVYDIYGSPYIEMRYDGYYFGGNKGLTTTQTFKDGSGATKTMTISGGVITAIA